MIQQIYGTINKRIDVGYDKSADAIFIHASSNCINFSYEEMECLMSVLTILHNCTPDRAAYFFSRQHIKLWELSPPPAETKL
jgi:hypothetical protein